MFVLSSIRLYSLYGSHAGTTSELSLYPEIRTKETQLYIYCTIGYYRGSADSWCYCETSVCEVRSQLDYTFYQVSYFSHYFSPSSHTFTPTPPHKHTHTLIINSICGIKAHLLSGLLFLSLFLTPSHLPPPPHTHTTVCLMLLDRELRGGNGYSLLMVRL